MRFSVVIPVYNKANTIEMSLNSILSQTEKDFEIVIVNDGSTDGIGNVLSKYDGITVINQENGGVSVARNTGIKSAKGNFVCFLDADDIWKEDHLSTLSSMIDEFRGESYFITSHTVVNPDGTVSHSSKYLNDFEGVFRSDDLLGLLNTTSYDVIHTNCICAKRSAFFDDSIFFEPGIKIGEDTDVWYRLGLKNSIVVSKHETAEYHRENSTATKESFHVYDWIFASREEDIVSDESITETRKKSAVALIDRYRLTSSRQYMIKNMRNEAKKLLKKIKNKKGKRYFLTCIFCNMPYFLCKCVFRKMSRQ